MSIKSSFRSIATMGVLSLLLGTLAVPQAGGKPIAPVQVPITRLLRNMGEYVKAHPKDAEGYYTLGRINSAAFARESETLSLYPDTEDKPPRFPYFTPIIMPRTE